MLLLGIGSLPEGDDWEYELKLDGYRATGFKSGGKVHLRSRNNKDFAPQLSLSSLAGMYYSLPGKLQLSDLLLVLFYIVKKQLRECLSVMKRHYYGDLLFDLLRILFSCRTLSENHPDIKCGHLKLGVVAINADIIIGPNHLCAQGWGGFCLSGHLFNTSCIGQ